MGLPLDLMEASIRRLGYGQILFVLLLFVMAAIRPDVYFGNGGVSEYALMPSTAPVFVVAFLSAAASMWVVAGSLPATATGKGIRFALRLCAALTIGLVVFPAIGDGFVDHLHIWIAIILFTVESLLVIWLAAGMGRCVVNLGLLAILLVAALASLLSLYHIVQCKTQAEILFQLSFNLLLTRLLRGKVPPSRC